MKLPPATAPRFFDAPAAFRRWLKTNHARERELWVGFWKKATGRPTLTWSEAVDEALCFGWIDGLKRAWDAKGYIIRFTPRKPGSAWSALNLVKMQALTEAGQMTASGRRAFDASDHTRSGYAVRHFKADLDPVLAKQFRAARRGWAFFQKQPPGYRRMAQYWVMSAKRQVTRERRLAALIAASAAARRVGA